MSNGKQQYLIVHYDGPQGPDTEQCISDRTLPDYGLLIQAVNDRLESMDIQWRIKTWQAAVAAECLAGHDVVIKAQTGSGKSLCYYSLAILHPRDCILVICPLLALMADQVRSAAVLGIKAIQLSAATMREDPELLNKVRGGEYSMVLVAAEFTASDAWKSLIRDDRTGRVPSFAQSLRRIIIDEAHLVREWCVFRPHYRNLGLLRTRFPRVPIMACSATLPKDTLAYIHKSLHLESPTILCDMPTDRPNISLFTAPIRKRQVDSFQPLLDLVPENVATWDPELFGEADWSPLNMPKTLVFIDDKNACCTLTTLLINKFPEHLRRSEARDVICEYHSTMSQKALDRNLQSLRDGTCRIMVCTDAVGMGLDVPDIERVIQWKVPPFLTVSGWWQRAGRAARNQQVAGIATIYYEPSFVVDPESPFCGRPGVEQEMELVYDAIQEQEASAEATEAGPNSRRRRRKGSLPCEGQLLWYLNTKGCIREVAMHYLGSKPDLRPAFNEYEQGAPCCCRCYRESGFDPDLFMGFPVRTCTPFVDSNGDAETGGEANNTQPDVDAEANNTQPDVDAEDNNTQVKPSSKSRIRLAVRLSLKVWRQQALPKHQQSDPMLRAKHILSDSIIAKLEAKCFVVKQPADLTAAISGPGRDVIRYTRISDNTAELAELINQVIGKSTAPVLPHRSRNAPYVQAPPKPLYSEDDIALVQMTPAVAHMMRNANQELRQFDLAAVNAKETARQKQNSSRQLRKLIFAESQQADSMTTATESVATQSVADSVGLVLHSQLGAHSVAGSVYSEDDANTQQTDRQLMPPPPLPVKRGRGRPRKTATQGSIAPSESSAYSTASDLSDEPPKKRSTRADTSTEAQSQPGSSADAPLVKRGRGRPRGSKNRPKQLTLSDARAPSVDPSQASVPLAHRSSAEPQTEPGSSVEPQTEPGSSVEPQTEPGSSADAPVVKRGRGRPREAKNQTKQLTPSVPRAPSADTIQTSAEHQASLFSENDA
jgi:superfamily II DNA or RNA helicase